ncbi:NUDIX domain-containing protein [Kitasatospora sp. NPDC057198]|uniref:NUDIX domain-containing protein n=1 Tax=Kitasatospora sp. NPDC057198 TaxID=3346046 RepID=UPI00363B1FE2
MSFLPLPSGDRDWLPPEEFVTTLPRATVYASLYITDQQDRPILLNSSVYVPDDGTQVWQFPGGQMDAGETPDQTALREAREEMGLTLACGRLLAVHFRLPEATWPANKIGLIFDGGQLSTEQIAAIRLDPGEHSEWAARPLDQWAQVLRSTTADRLRQTAAAKKTGTTAYIA